MEVSGSCRIPAPRDAVWAALNDPGVVKDCIPGCSRLETVGDDAFEGAVAAKIGPIRAEFAGTATRDASAAPDRLTLAGQGDAGPSGSLVGRAELRLTDEGAETLIDYTAEADVGGKIGQLGSRLIGGFARKSADEFFASLSRRLSEGGFAPATPPTAEAPPLVHEEPAEAPAATVVAEPPPLAASPVPPTLAETAPNAIAPTATPVVPGPEEIVASEQAAAKGASAVTRIMLVAAVVIVVGAAFYYVAFQAPH